MPSVVALENMASSQFLNMGQTSTNEPCRSVLTRIRPLQTTVLLVLLHWNPGTLHVLHSSPHHLRLISAVRESGSLNIIVEPEHSANEIHPPLSLRWNILCRSIHLSESQSQEVPRRTLLERYEPLKNFFFSKCIILVLSFYKSGQDFVVGFYIEPFRVPYTYLTLVTQIHCLRFYTGVYTAHLRVPPVEQVKKKHFTTRGMFFR